MKIICTKCKSEISNGEKHASLVYTIENMKLDNGGLSVDVISGEDLVNFCSRCMRNNDEVVTRQYLMSIIKQADPKSN